jgi:hypothetical protein
MSTIQFMEPIPITGLRNTTQKTATSSSGTAGLATSRCSIPALPSSPTISNMQEPVMRKASRRNTVLEKLASKISRSINRMVHPQPFTATMIQSSCYFTVIVKVLTGRFSTKTVELYLPGGTSWTIGAPPNK